MSVFIGRLLGIPVSDLAVDMTMDKSVQQLSIFRLYENLLEMITDMINDIR